MRASNVGKVMREVSAFFGVTAADIRSTRRTKALLPARHIAVYLTSKFSGLPPERIGERFGRRDPTIIRMYCRAVIRRMAQDQDFAASVSALEGRIARLR